MALSSLPSDWDSFPLPLDWSDSLTGYEFGINDKTLDWDQSLFLPSSLPSSEGCSWQLASSEIGENDALWNPFELGNVLSPIAGAGLMTEYGVPLQPQDSELSGQGIQTSPHHSQNRVWSERPRSSHIRQKQAPKRPSRSRTMSTPEPVSTNQVRGNGSSDSTIDKLRYSDVDVCDRPSKRLKTGPSSRQSDSVSCSASIEAIYSTNNDVPLWLRAHSPSRSNTSLDHPTPSEDRPFSIGLSSPLSSPSSSSFSSPTSSFDTPSSTSESGIEYRLLSAPDLGPIPSIPSVPPFDYDGESSKSFPAATSLSSSSSSADSADDDILTPLEMPDGSIRYTVNWLPVEPGDIFI